MTGLDRGVQDDTDILVRQVDRHLAWLRLRSQDQDLAAAERIAACLRDLIVETAHASAADRARVRAAVRYFVLRRPGRAPARRGESIGVDERVLGEVARQLGRADLVAALTGEGSRAEATPSTVPH